MQKKDALESKPQAACARKQASNCLRETLFIRSESLDYTHSPYTADLEYISPLFKLVRYILGCILSRARTQSSQLSLNIFFRLLSSTGFLTRLFDCPTLQVVRK
ncbi:hypothetical protein AB1Y20_019708 [Prymnesium parvum]|uniref:Peroxisomal membrane protein PEX16 n=1 Tax=Prymnesium parvum TaxID=97485 RepID=A0AB34JV84_PRYPA|mmetsp:Transcript_29992/g.45342  ORF Transcript_29992/g.45342 Transcript_29992/m.45342 type:complete len:104 (-) Transcript_29992:345-656(-)